MPAQEREFLVSSNGAPVVNGHRNVLSHSQGARVKGDKNIENSAVDTTGRDDVTAHNNAASSSSSHALLLSQSSSAKTTATESPKSVNSSSTRRAPHSNGGNNVDSAATATADGGAVSDEASSSETDDSSQTSSNGSSSGNGEDDGGIPPQPAQHAGGAAKVNPSKRLLLPPAEVLTDTSTLILFDWDDTLLASTHLANSNYRLDEPDVLPEAVVQQLSLLEDAVIEMLDLAATMGTVCIITNAETGWVELSCKKFLPRVMAHVERLPVFSARSTYEPAFPSLPSKWKLEAFSHRIGQLCEETSPALAKNVISLGDSHAEREAVRTVTRDLPSVIAKSVKFVERPTLEQLMRQLQLVVRVFPMICDMRRDLDLALTVEALQVA